MFKYINLYRKALNKKFIYKVLLITLKIICRNLKVYIIRAIKVINLSCYLIKEKITIALSYFI